METPIISGQSGAAAGTDPDLIKESDTAHFVADVIEASRTGPVIVDFWAPWCGPCKQLTPVLEKVVGEAGGAVRLVKVNVDENQALASQIGVQSIPAVFAFDGGRPIDAFMGALPESEVKAFIDRLAPEGAVGGESGELAAARAAFEAGDIEGAARIFATLLQADSADIDAIAGLAGCFVEIGDSERAEQILDQAPPEASENAEIAALRNKLDLAKMAPDADELETLRAKVAGAADDFQARYDLALALNASSAREEAVEHLMAIMTRQADWNDEAARKLLLQFFEAWGPQDPATLAGRQQLSSLLFS